MKFKMLCLVLLAAGISACQSNQQMSEEDIIDSVAAETKKEQLNKDTQTPNPAKCQQAKLDLVEVESSGDIPQINRVKATIMQYCDNIE